MSLSLLPESYPSHHIPPPLTGTNLWSYSSLTHSLLSKIPAKVLHKIISYLLCSRPHSTRLRKQILFTFSSTCSLFREFFRNDLYFSINIRSASSLARFSTYLDTHTWPSQSTAINFLTLRWLQVNHDCFLATPVSRHEACQKITLNLRLILETHTEGLQSLTLDFPGAGISFQSAILATPTFTHKRHLRHLHITNGLCPLLKPAIFLLCAISALCARSIEELIIDIVCEAVNTQVKESYPNRLRVPGRQMFCIFERLQRLRKLDVKGIEGFTDGCLAWVLSGSQLTHARRNKGKALILEKCQSLTEGGVKRILGIVGGGLEEARVVFVGNESAETALEESGSVPTPEIWLTLGYEDKAFSRADNNVAFSFIYDSDSISDTMERESTVSETIYEDEIFHLDISGDFPDISSHSTNKNSYNHSHHISYQSAYSHKSSYVHQPLYQPSHNIHICDITATACKHLHRLDVPISSSLPYPSSENYYNENKSRNSYSLTSEHHPTPTFSDKDAEYINRHLFSRAAARVSAPTAHRLQKPMSHHSSNSSLPIFSSSAPTSGFLGKEAQQLVKPRGTDLKGSYKLTDEAAVARGFKFVSLRGLWGGVGSVGGGRQWFKYRK